MSRGFPIFRHAGLDPASRFLARWKEAGPRIKSGVTVVLLYTLGLATPALAQTQAQMTAQAGVELRRADAVMTAQWRRTYTAMKRLDAPDTSRGGGFGYAAALLASQRAWLKYRDAQCVIEGAEFAGGSLQRMTRATCLTRLTRGRTRQLETLLWKR